MNGAVLTVAGNLTANPELRYTASGRPVASVTVASTERVYDKDAKQYKDGATTFLRCSVWGDMGENVAASLVKGDRVTVVGRLVQREYDKDGEKRVSYDVQVEEISASLRYATVKTTKVTRAALAAVNTA